MRRIILTLTLLACLLPVVAAKRVYVLAIDQEIDATAWRHTRRAIDEVRSAEQPFDLLLLHLNTYGGEVDMADSIRTAIMRVGVPTVAFVDHNAASAGALIALACDSTFMSPGASMGAATVVNQSGEPMPPKYQNYWSSVMRSTAMAHGKYVPEGDSVAHWRRDPAVAADMVMPEKAIAFTADEAVARGMADGVASTVDDVLTQLNCRDAQIVVYQSTMSDDILGFLASAGVRAILIMLILGGIYMEMHTPGLGFAAAVSTVAAVLYFLPMIVTGTLAPWVLLAFIIGVVLLALEVFVIPGFGVAGVSGILAITASLLGAMLHYSELGGIEFGGLGKAIAVLCSGIALSIGAVLYITSRYAPKRLQRMSALTLEQNVEDGYVGVDPTLAALVGKQGVAFTDLRPSGKVEIDGVRYDATSTGAFIHSGAKVTVVRYEAAQLYVDLI